MDCCLRAPTILVSDASAVFPMTADLSPILLDETQIRFLTQRVSILMGSCSAEGIPSVVRAYGCRVSPDRRSLTVFLAVKHSDAVLKDLRAGAAVTAVFSKPSTHGTLQLKGTHAHIVPLAEGDRELMRVYGQSFRDELSSIGCLESFTQGITAGAEEEAIGVSFTPTAAFEQTPGPSAGQPLVQANSAHQ